MLGVVRPEPVALVHVILGKLGTLVLVFLVLLFLSTVLLLLLISVSVGGGFAAFGGPCGTWVFGGCSGV
jgi:hypothetical protein